MPQSSRTTMSRDIWEVLGHVMLALGEIKSDLADIKAKYDAHTHNADGSEAGSYFTSEPRTDAEGVSAGTASAIQTLATTVPSF